MKDTQDFLLEDLDDEIVWKLENNKRFSVKSMYNALTKNDTDSAYKRIWKAKVPQKIKIFVWLILCPIMQC